MNDALGDRMKGYENISRDYLMSKTPVIVRVDGRAFHTYTKNFTYPFDKNIINAMCEAARFVQSDMQNFIMGYVQSDEASFVMYDIAGNETQPWLGNNKQKIISIVASIFTVAFNNWIANNVHKGLPWAIFDARAFNLPSNIEVANYFLWRYKDWIRNSINMYARHFFSHKEMENKSIPEIHEMLHTLGKNWVTDLTNQEKNGTILLGRHTVICPDHVLIHNELQIMFDEEILKIISEKEQLETNRNSSSIG